MDMFGEVISASLFIVFIAATLIQCIIFMTDGGKK